MFLNIVFLIVGLIALIYGANKLVDGGAALAARMNIPNIVIGLTVVAFGTSAPELVVSTVSSIDKQSTLAFGNVIGSNIFNVLMILSLCAIIFPIDVQRNTTKIEIPFVVLSAVLVLIMFLIKNTGIPPVYTISRTEGIILLGCFCIFMYYTFRLAKAGNNMNFQIRNHSTIKSILFIIIGLSGLVLGGRLLVKGAVGIAEAMHISQRIIAITIVSVGTSLPELATSIIAARKKEVDIAVGNIVGSTLFNTFFILGISAVICPINLSWENSYDLIINLLASVLLLAFIFTGKSRKIGRKEGVLMLLVYVAYIFMLIKNV